jgi:hypothetical protein
LKCKVAQTILLQNNLGFFRTLRITAYGQNTDPEKYARKKKWEKKAEKAFP